MILFTPDDFKPIAFYGYPSYQSYIFSEYNELEDKGEKGAKRFFEKVLKDVEHQVGKKLMDNKIVIKLQFNRNPSTIIYCGYKDGYYRLSLEAQSESFVKLNLQ